MPASWDAKMLLAFAALSEFHVLWVRPPTHKMRVLAADPWDSFKGVAGPSDPTSAESAGSTSASTAASASGPASVWKQHASGK